MTELDKFTNAYIRAMLWTENEDSREDGRSDVALEVNYDASDFAPDAMARIKDDCRVFQERAGNWITSGDSESWRFWFLAEMAGHDFWLTRNGHGAGFWDGDWPENGGKLTELSHHFGEVWPYVGDDGLIYLS